MLSNVKLASLLLLPVIVNAAGVPLPVGMMNNSATPYKVQEDAFFDPVRYPEIRNNTKSVFFLAYPKNFPMHKSTLFSRITSKAEMDCMNDDFNFGNYGLTQEFADSITVEDAKAISSKHHDYNACREFAPLLMGTSPKCLRALNADCIEAVANAVKAIKADGAALGTQHALAKAFIDNSYKLDKSIWSKNFPILAEITKTPDNDYSKYGTLIDLFVKDDDRCHAVDATEFLKSITTAQASKITRASCFTSMNGFENFAPTEAKHVAKLPKHTFAEVDFLFKNSEVYGFMTNEQIAEFGSRTKDTHCAVLAIPALHKSRLSQIDAACWNSYLTGFGTGSSVPPMNKLIKLIRPDAWKDVKTEGFSRIHQDDIPYISSTVVNKFLEANPEFCEELDKIDTDKVRIIVPDCFIRLTGEQQMKVMEKRGSSFPVNILERFTRETVEKFDGNVSFLRNVKFTPEQVKAIGRDSKKPEEHPCSALSKDDLLSTESLMSNMSEHCFAALTCLEDLEPSDLSHLPKSLLALLPFDKLMLMIADDKDYFANLDAAGMKHLTSKDFCSKVTQPVFEQIKAPALASVDERCAAALTFKKTLTKERIRAFSKRAFRLFTKDMLAELPAITALTPEQFHELSADVKDVKQSAAQQLTKETLATLPSEYVAKMSEELLGAVPAASFAAFTKDTVVVLPAASLRRVSAEQVKGVPVEALSALTVAQVQELGAALTEASTSPITHLLNDKNVKLSTEAQTAAVKRAEQDKERFAKSAAANKKDASSASTIGVSALGLVLAAAALAL